MDPMKKTANIRSTQSKTPKAIKPIRVAMIGGGVNSAVGRVHEIAMKMDNLFSLEAGCFSRNFETNQETGRQYAISPKRVYATAKDLLKAEKGKVDAIVVTTPIQDHVDHIHWALDAGFTVISDKPLLASAQECEDLLQRVDGLGTEVFSIFNYTGYPAVREMRHRILNGEIGDVFKVMAEMPQDSFMRLKNQDKAGAIQPWRLKDGVVPCVTLDLFVHLHSLVHFVTGKLPQKVTATSRSISGVSKGLIDEVDAIIQYQGNMVVNAWYGKAALGCRNGLKVRVFGTKGSLQWLQEDGEHLAVADELGNRRIIDRISTDSAITVQNRYNRFKAGHPSGFIEAFANYYADIAQAIHAGQLNEFTLSTYTASQGLALSEAIARASTSGKAQTLKLSHPPVVAGAH